MYRAARATGDGDMRANEIGNAFHKLTEVYVDRINEVKDKETSNNLVEEILKDKEYLESVYAKGAQRAEAQARKTLRKVYKKVGLIEKKFI